MNLHTSLISKSGFGKSRRPIKSVSDKRKAWLDEYRSILSAYTPEECARCDRRGKGWRHMGGDFEPHHPYRRFKKWMTCCVIPLCHECHEEVEFSSTKAREDGWIIEPKRR